LLLFPFLIAVSDSWLLSLVCCYRYSSVLPSSCSSIPSAYILFTFYVAVQDNTFATCEYSPSAALDDITGRLERTCGLSGMNITLLRCWYTTVAVDRYHYG
jgi:hypothetical protein